MSSALPIRRPGRFAWTAWALVCVLWGTTYLAIKIALVSIPPFLMGGIRNILAGVILGIAVWLRGRPLPMPKEWGRLTLLGFCMFVLGNGGVVWGVQHVPTGLAAVVIGTSPFWMVSIDAALTRGRQLHARQWVGLAVGFAGIVLLVWPDIAGRGARRPEFAMGIVAMQIACAGWAFGAAYSRRTVASTDLLSAASAQMFFGGILMTLVGTAVGEWGALHFAQASVLALLYLTLVGSVIAFAAFSYALQHLDVAIVSLYTYINPVIAIALGTIFLDEPFHLRMLVAAAVILIGVVIVGPTNRTGPTASN